MSQNPYSTPQRPGGPGPPQGDRFAAANKVKGPALGMLISTITGMLIALIGLALNILGISFMAASGEGVTPDTAGIIGQGVFAIAQGLIGLVGGGVIIFGCIKMLKLQAYGFAFTTSILAMIPCISPCCLLGIPFGIWGLVVLNDPQVKQFFK